MVRECRKFGGSDDAKALASLRAFLCLHRIVSEKSIVSYATPKVSQVYKTSSEILKSLYSVANSTVRIFATLNSTKNITVS